MKSPLCRISKASNANALALIKMRNFFYFFSSCADKPYMYTASYETSMGTAVLFINLKVCSSVWSTF